MVAVPKIVVVVAAFFAASVAAIIPHPDPKEAIRHMHRRGPVIPNKQAGTVASIDHDAEIRRRYQFDGPYEYIADVEFGLKAKPTADDTGYDIDSPKQPPFSLPVQKPIVQASPPSPSPLPVHVPLKTVHPTPPPIIHRNPPPQHSIVPPVPLPPAHSEPKTNPKPLVPEEVATQIREATSSLAKPLDLSDSAHRAMTSKQIFAEIKRYADLIRQQKEAREAIRAIPPVPVPVPVSPVIHPPQHVTSADSVSRSREQIRRSIIHRSSSLKVEQQPTQFVLLFRGQCTANESEDGKSGGKNECKLKASSQSISTLIHPAEGVNMTVQRLMGSVAHMHIFDISMISETAFTSRGNLSFGSTRHKPHSLRYEAAGEARVIKLKSGERQFTAQYQISGGEWTFENARGTITINGRLLSKLKVEALVTGVVYSESALLSRHERARGYHHHHHARIHNYELEAHRREVAKQLAEVQRKRSEENRRHSVTAEAADTTANGDRKHFGLRHHLLL